MEVGLWNMVAMLLFVLEAYHVLGHTAVLFRIRMLPRRDLVRIRSYFLLDGFTTFVVAFFVTGRLQWLVLLHLVQHLYYYFTWEKSSFAKRVSSAVKKHCWYTLLGGV
ncbi:hypothetical protein C0Q70_11242 [Pomacea canaliculata]|uniref:Uncharacterized protein n=1 Tax=Pomacea canaliculata TaxID=400727 RepID=A0A2T7P5G4_POMCA|nr:hypothetical protein C0Q70_11242 [Pomacea canaliculata]